MNRQKTSPTQAICNHIRMYHNAAPKQEKVWWRREQEQPGPVTITAFAFGRAVGTFVQR